MFNLLRFVCGLSLVFISVWLTGAQTDRCTGRANIVLAVPGGAGQVSKIFEENLIDLMYHFPIDPYNTNIGLLLYGENSQTVLSPGDYKTRTQVNTRITMMSQRQLYYSTTLMSGQDLLKGLRTMEDMFKGVSLGVRKIGVVFTEGLINSTQNEGRDILDAATRLKDSGVVMYNLGSNISSEVGGVFEFIGTDRCRLFSMGNFSDSLSSAIPYLASGICSEIDPRQTVGQGNCYPKTYFKENPQEVVCPLELSWALLPDPNNCAYYYQCVPNVRRNPMFAGNERVVPEVMYPPFPVRNEPTRRQCSDGTLFENGFCTHFANVSCYTD